MQSISFRILTKAGRFYAKKRANQKNIHNFAPLCCMLSFKHFIRYMNSEDVG